MKMLDGQPARRPALTVSGRTVAENIARAEVFNDDVIRPLDKAIYAEGATAVLPAAILHRAVP